jgi:glycosyltransferase involved in cell wall biosynthesis
MHSSISPLVSIVIPFLNAEQFLMETMESVISQHYTNWEILLVDDGSTDGSTAIAKKYASGYPDKIYFLEHNNHSNRGAAASRNLGVSKASGALLAFLDSDDLWLPNKLEEQVAFMNGNPQVSVLCEATQYWYSWYNPEAKDPVIRIGAPADQEYTPPKLATLLYPLGNGDSFCTCAMMMRTAAFRALGGFNETFIGVNQLFEDQVLFLKICLNERVYLSSKCNNIYRQRPNSLMHGIVANGHHDQALYFFLKWLRNYVTQKGIQDKEVNRLLNKALLYHKYPLFFKISGSGRRIGSKIKKKLKAIFNNG